MSNSKKKETRDLKARQLNSDANPQPRNAPRIQASKSNKTNRSKHSLTNETLQISNNNVDFYSSIFADASSGDEDDFSVRQNTTSESSTKGNKLYKFKRSDYVSAPALPLKQGTSNSLGNRIISSKKDATKPPTSAPFKTASLVKSKDPKLINKANSKMVKPSKSQIRTIKPGFPIIAESSSESDDNDEFVYDDENESDDNDEHSELEVIGVGVRSSKDTSFRTNEDEVEIKEEAIGMSDEDIEREPEISNSADDSEEEEHIEKDQSFEDSNRTAIREELSNLTYEELEELKNKLGTKEYYEAMFGKEGPKSNQRKKKIVYKRENKNRPRELPVRLHVPKVREVIHVKKVTRRDPRFEDSCGDLNEQIWEKNYDFLKDIQKEEAQQLQKSLKTEEDAERRKEIRKYLQTVRNKEASKVEKEKQLQKRRQEKDENIKRLKEGKNPFYLKKSTRKVMDLAEKYEELKATGKLEKYLKKKRKKNQGRDKKALKLVKPKS